MSSLLTCQQSAPSRRSPSSLHSPPLASWWRDYHAPQSSRNSCHRSCNRAGVNRSSYQNEQTCKCKHQMIMNSPIHVDDMMLWSLIFSSQITMMMLRPWKTMQQRLKLKYCQVFSWNDTTSMKNFIFISYYVWLTLTVEFALTNTQCPSTVHSQLPLHLPQPHRPRQRAQRTTENASRYTCGTLDTATCWKSMKISNKNFFFI